MELTSVSNWTRWESHPSPKDEYWVWDRIPPAFWYWLRDTLYWLPIVLVIAYWVGIRRLHEYMSTRSSPVECRLFRIIYNIFITIISIFIVYKAFYFFPLPNILTSEGLYIFLCVRRHLKDPAITYLAMAIFLRIFHFLDTIFVVLDKKPLPSLQMVHHSVAILLPTFLVQYEEPYIISLMIVVGTHHCIVYPLSTIKAFGMKLPKWLSITMLVLEGSIMLSGCFASAYAANVIRNGGKCYRHPTSALVFNCGLLCVCFYVIKVLLTRFVFSSKNKSL